MYQNEDFNKHETVSFILQRGDRYLMFYHNKYNKWTIPIGKFDISKEKPSMALSREAFEELDIVVENAIPVECRSINYDLNDININSLLFLYKIIRYKNIPINKEIYKHSIMDWFTKEEIYKLDNISEATKVFLEVIK